MIPPGASKTFSHLGALDELVGDELAGVAASTDTRQIKACIESILMRQQFAAAQPPAQGPLVQLGEAVAQAALRLVRVLDASVLAIQ